MLLKEILEEEMSKIKKMDIKEFRAIGLLQEVNRLFFHPRGLALEIIIDNETGKEKLGGIWDYRNDPEGIKYLDQNLDEQKAANVMQMLIDKSKFRQENLGFIIQPLKKKSNA